MLPDTGASTNITSGRIRPSVSLIRVVSVTPIVPICAHTAPGANASAAPPMKMTECAASAVGSMVITTLASRLVSTPSVDQF